MHRLIFGIAVGSCAVLLSGGVSVPAAQTAQAQTVPQFRSRVEIVHLDVSVLDRDRRPVRGLTARDFSILENGVAQELSVFTPVDVPEVTPSMAAWVRDVAPDVRGNANVSDRRLFVIAIDDATLENDQRTLQNLKQIGHGVIDRLSPADVASIVFTRDNRNAQDFTSDRERLKAAIDATTVGFRDMAQGAPGLEGADDMWYLYSAGVLERAVDFLSELPDKRKAIIYIGQGLPFNPEEAAMPTSGSAVFLQLKDRLTETFERASIANVNIYTIDACGLRQPPPPPMPSGTQTIGALRPKCVIGPELDYLTGLAAATGGRPVINTSEFDTGLTEVFAENASYYLLGFQSANPARDGRFRRLEVRVNRPDVEVRTRTGYDAPRAEPAAASARPGSPLGAAMSSVLPQGDLPMQIMAAPFPVIVKGKLESAVAVTVGFRQPIRPSDERYIEHVDVRITAFNNDGRSFGGTNAKVDVAIRAGSTGTAEYEAMARLPLRPGKYQLRMAAYVESLGTLGSLFYDIDVPDFAGEPFGMSGLVVSATPQPVFGPKEGLKELMSVIPTTRRLFTPAHRVSAFARLYQGGRRNIVPAVVTMEVRDVRDRVVATRDEAVAARQFQNRAADVRFDVPTSGLEPGAYLLTVRATAGSSTLTRNSRFQIAR